MVVLPEVIKLWFIDKEFPWLVQHRLFAASVVVPFNRFGSGELISLLEGAVTIQYFSHFDLFQELCLLVHLVSRAFLFKLELNSQALSIFGTSLS